MKQTDVKKVKIGDKLFYIRPFPALKAANLSVKIGSIAGPVLSAFAPLVSSQSNIMDVDMDSISKPLMDAFSGLDGDKLERIISELLIDSKNISVETSGDVSRDSMIEILNEDLLNEMFCMEIEGMFQLVWEVILVNYGGFFGKASNLFGKAQEGMTKISMSKNTESSMSPTSTT